MKQRFTAGLLFFIVAVQWTWGVIPDMKFRRLDTRDGLSNTQVNSIVRDSRGQVWIATPYGLNRYDGYRVRSFYSHANDSTTMPVSYVDDILEDGVGRLWLRHGTAYSIFDPQTEMCDRHPEGWLRERGIEGNVERVFIDRNHNIWVKTYDTGLWFLNPCDGKLKHFTFGNGQQQIDADMGVSDMVEYGRSLLIVSNNGDIFCFNTSQVRLSWKSRRLRQLGTARNAGYHVFVDVQGNIWMLVNGRPYVYVRCAGRWVESATEALQLLGIQGFPHDIKIWDITSDHHGQLWFSTDHHGLFVINLQDGTKRQFLTAKNDETTISDNTLRRIYCDQLGRMWIATYMNGVNYYAENLFHFKNVMVGNVNTVCVDRSGKYWLGTNDRGIICYDLATGAQTVYNKANSGLGADIIVSSLSANDGVLWFGTYEGGLIRYKDGRFTTYKATGQPDGLAHNSVWSLAEDQWGNIWIGTLGGGLQRIDRQTGRFTTFNMQTSKLSSNYISSIQLTEEGLLLLSHTDFYSMMNPKTMKIENVRIEPRRKDIPVTPSSNQVVQDSRGLVWQGATSGATVCDLKTGETYLLDSRSGLFGSTVNGLVEDLHHTMWVVTDKALSSVVPQQRDGQWTFIVRSFNNRDGLMDAPYNQRSAILTPDGQVVIGGYEGIDIINPQHMGVQRGKETPLLSGVKVMDGSIRRVGDHLRLSYNERQFIVQLSSSSGEVHNRARFAYRLLGFSSQWLYTEEAVPDITYMGLPAGSYTLCVRMLNDDGTLGTEEVTLPISIAAPWYRSWWMQLIYLLIALLAVHYAYRRYQEKLRLQQLKMEQESRHRLDEQKQQFYETVSDELRKPFHDTFESLNDMMQRETDEQRYERQQQVFRHVESLLEQVNMLAENGRGKNKLQPQVRELEITSLDEKLIRDATKYVEDNLDNADISVETMAAELGMSRVHLYKKLTAITDLTPSEFIRQIRLRYAEQLLRKSQLTVAEVAYKVGFNNPRYFSKYFKEMYGMIPSEYKNQRNNDSYLE